MGDVINLRQERKRREQAERRRQAAGRRAGTGRTKAERQRSTAEQEQLEHTLDGHRLDETEPH